MIKRSHAAEYEIACHMAHELYPMDRKKREEYIRNRMRKKSPPPWYIPYRLYHSKPWYPRRWKP